MTELRGHLAAGRHGVDIQLVDLWSEDRGDLVNTGVSTAELELEVSNSHLADAFKDLESNIVDLFDRIPQILWVVAGIVEGEGERHGVKCRFDFFEHSKTTGHITQTSLESFFHLCILFILKQLRINVEVNSSNEGKDSFRSRISGIIGQIRGLLAGGSHVYLVP
jgi:hypothetical protein